MKPSPGLACEVFGAVLAGLPKIEMSSLQSSLEIGGSEPANPFIKLDVACEVFGAVLAGLPKMEMPSLQSSLGIGCSEPANPFVKLDVAH